MFCRLFGGKTSLGQAKPFYGLDTYIGISVILFNQITKTYPITNMHCECILQDGVHIIHIVLIRQNDHDIFKCIFFNENLWISIEMSMNYCPNGPIVIKSVFVPAMTWRQKAKRHDPNKRWSSSVKNDDVIKWRHFPPYWQFVRGIQRSPVNSPHKGQRGRALMFSLICVWINGWVNNREAGDLKRHRGYYDVIATEYVGRPPSMSSSQELRGHPTRENCLRWCNKVRADMIISYSVSQDVFLHFVMVFYQSFCLGVGEEILTNGIKRITKCIKNGNKAIPGNGIKPQTTCCIYRNIMYMNAWDREYYSHFFSINSPYIDSLVR